MAQGKGGGQAARVGPRILRGIRGPWGSVPAVTRPGGACTAGPARAGTCGSAYAVFSAPAASAAMSVRYWEPSRRMRATAR
ncbi:hypothetical protein SAMN05216505_11466 [Streptomyces prasinopilosus]|uniref:Uncharacterized protein n=1 Tax=Streptomyces prasinopilosus TaxID=67344 RepID=A0A1G6Z4E6_9ACTN|nr:hypothetical protein SAMN05216505_11466 [Streptomyces prasinopilosus]